MKFQLCDFKKITNLKINNFFKLYLLIFSFLNFTYTCLEIHNFKLKSLFSSLGTSLMLIKETYPLEFIRSVNITKANDIIYYLIICINLFCLIMLINKKFNINTKQFLITHFIYLFFIFFINYILSIIFSAPIGNLIVQLLPAYKITFIISIYYIIKTLYKKIGSLNY